MPESSLWNLCLHRLEGELPEQNVNTWLRPLKAEHDNSTLRLYAPNRFACEKVKTTYKKLIAETANSVIGSPIQVEINVVNGNNRSLDAVANSQTGKAVSRTAKDKRHKLPFGFGQLNPDYTLERHVMGESNKLARMLAAAISENPGERTLNPFFIYGEVGVGKTHLMHATGHRILELNPSAKVGYVQASSFVQHLVTLFKKKDNDLIESFKEAYRSLDTLLIDDVHLFAGASASQQEFLHTFNALLEGQKQIIITSDRFFKELNEVEDRLKSRIGQGMTIAIKPPELETRIAILESKAELRGIELGRDVSYFMAEKIRSNVRELEGALNRLVADHRFLGHEITIELAQKVLSDLITYNEKPPEISFIQTTVANYYDIRVEGILSKSRKKEVTLPRHIAMTLARELTNESLPNIGKSFGNRNHATIIHACKVINGLVESSPKIANEYGVLKKMLSN